ncbi:hypothetical protein GCM10023074_09870 [Microbispora amethystogenes]|uniref:Uncharacterized protein n=1 Tax=Microbispora amethystogenes TaxID=1427754 RepID=A0ABQ4FIC6_9ACTN|nr:hypothetical protein Mam01_47510 [Microbispora amethystogenes]
MIEGDRNPRRSAGHAAQQGQSQPWAKYAKARTLVRDPGLHVAAPIRRDQVAADRLASTPLREINRQKQHTYGVPVRKWRS